MDTGRTGRPSCIEDGRLDTYDIPVWRDEQGKIAWTTLHPYWMPEDQIDQLHELLKARGFTGTRHDDYTEHHTVIFQQGELQLLVRASRAEPKTRKQLEAKADVFMDDLYWKSKGWKSSHADRAKSWPLPVTFRPVKKDHS